MVGEQAQPFVDTEISGTVNVTTIGNVGILNSTASTINPITLTTGTVGIIGISGSITAPFTGAVNTSTFPVSFPSTSTLGASVTIPENQTGTLPITALPGNTSTVSLYSNTSTVNIPTTGGTYDVRLSAAGVMAPVDIQGRYLNPTTLINGVNLSASTTTDWVDVSTYYNKTVSVISAQQAGTLVIQVSPMSSTTTAYTYLTENNVAANTFTTKSFTEALYWARLVFTPAAASTTNAWIARMS